MLLIEVLHKADCLREGAERASRGEGVATVDDLAEVLIMIVDLLGTHFGHELDTLLCRVFAGHILSPNDCGQLTNSDCNIGYCGFKDRAAEGLLRRWERRCSATANSG